MMFNDNDSKNGGEHIRKIGTFFSGSVSDMLANGVKSGQRPVLDQYSCTLTLAANILTFSDSVLLYHSPNGCLDESFVIIYINSKIRGMELNNPFMYDLRNVHCVTTGLNEKDVIFGGEKKLKKAILEAKKRYNPEMICVLSSCTAAIIGDDIEAVCEDAQTELDDGTYVIPFFTQGFQSHGWINYADRIWIPLVERVMKKQATIDTDLLNFFRPINMSAADINEVERLMKNLNFRINIFPDFQSVEVLEIAPEAALNIGICKGYHQPVFEQMKKKFDTPYANAPYPLGMEFTDQWLREIGNKTGRQDLVEKLIVEERERIEPELQALRLKLKGKKAVISANHAKTLGFVQACHNLGIQIQAIFTHMSDEALNEEYGIIKAMVGDVPIHIGSPMWEQVAYLNHAKPDIYLAHPEFAAIASTFGIATKCTYLYFFQQAHIGYEGVLETGRQIWRGMTNPIRHKLFKYSRNQTGSNWKDSSFITGTDDPFQFAREGQPFAEKKCACGMSKQKNNQGCK